MVGQSALLEYRTAASQPESLELRVLSLLMDGPLSKNELSSSLGQKRVSGQLNKVVRSLLEQGKVMHTIPETPQSRLQKYRLTDKGIATISGFNTKG